MRVIDRLGRTDFGRVCFARESALRGVVLLVVLWVLAFSMACRIVPVAKPYERDFLFARMIGSTRLAFSEQFVVEADRWFHRGIGHFRPAALNSWFVSMYEQVNPRRHVHLEGEDVVEVIPWLYFATVMDPSNVEAYAVAAFFLASRAGRPDLAELVLREAQRRNPDDYLVYYERGRLALRMNKPDEAARFFNAAIRLWPGRLDPNSLDAKHDKAAMLVFRGLLHETQGDVDKAIQLYDKVLRMFPARYGLLKRVKELRADGRAIASPTDIWKMMLYHHPSVCDHDRH